MIYSIDSYKFLSKYEVNIYVCSIYSRRNVVKTKYRNCSKFKLDAYGHFDKFCLISADKIERF